MERVNPKSRRAKSERADSELALKIRELRSGLGYSQRLLAEALHVSRPQVVEWENGASERPSTEKLIEMAKICPSRALRKWFWIRAGFDLESLKSDFQAELSSPMMSSTQPVLKIPIITDRRLSWSEFVAEDPDGELPFPAGLLVHPQSVVCLRFSVQSPWFTEDSPAVIVDRTADDPEELLKKLVVVFFERLPFQFRTFGRDYDIDASATEWMMNFLKDKSRTPPDEPGLLAGQLDLQLIDELHSSPGDSKLWRVVLRTGDMQFIPRSREIPLSDWQTSGPVCETRVMLGSILRRGVRLYGKVLSWISPELLDRSLHR